jgi:2'-5' RNA ligase
VGPGELEEDPRSLRVRAFFGLPPPEPQRDQLRKFIEECARMAPDFRWVPAENLHLTVRFVGAVDRSLIEAVADALSKKTLVAFELGLGELGTFKRGRAVRVVWLGLRAGAGQASALAAEVDRECAKAGLVGEERPFQAHLTLARARARNGSTLPELPPAPKLDTWRAGELNVYSSRLTRTGAIYEVIRTLVLA